MAIGTLLAKIVLDEPKKVHYGTEKVTGKIVLVYTPSSKTREESNPELFGPLALAVVLHGRAKTKVWKSNGQSTSIYRGRVPLFSQRMKIFDDSFRTKPNVANPFRFELQFPAFASSSPGWENTGLFNYKEGDALPPSWSGAYSGFSNKYEAFVEYRVGVEIAMPRLQILIVKPEKYNEPLVYYDRPRLPAPISERPHPIRGSESVKNEFLLPEADRTTGFRAKAKAAFSSDYYPTYAFDWMLTAPQHLYIGQPLAMEVRIRPKESNTAILIPDVHLSSVYVSIKAFVNARAEKQIFSTPEAHSDEEKMSLRGVMEDTTPFGKANDWTKTINTRELRSMCSSFSCANISVSYQMNVRGVFEFAGKTKDFDRGFTVTIHPPLQQSSAQASSSATAGPSSQAYGMESLEAALPEYDRPPEYDEAINDETAPKVPPRDEKRLLGGEMKENEDPNSHLGQSISK